MTIANGSLPDANDVLNVYHHGGNVMMGKGGTIYIPVYINNADGDANVYLAMWGKAAGGSATTLTHGVGEHTNDSVTTGAVDTAATGINVIPYASVPMGVDVYVDGTCYTEEIGDQNSSGSTMYGEMAWTGFTGCGADYYASVSVSLTVFNTLLTVSFPYYRLVKNANMTLLFTSGDMVAYLTFTYDDDTTADTAEQSNGTRTFVNPNPTKKVKSIAFKGRAWSGGTPADYIVNYITLYKTWGVDGSTAFNTGWLDLTSTISWTAGWHYIELKELNNVGGTLVYQASVNTSGE